MRVVIKGADFSEVSIGKVTKDLSFRVCASYTAEEGVHGFVNYDAENHSANNIKVYRIDENDTSTVYYGAQSQRLQTDYIEVEPGMAVTSTAAFAANGSTSIIPNIVCFDENKILLDDSSTYAVWYNLGTSASQEISFVIPAGVKYIKIQSAVTHLDDKNIYVGTMPAEE